MNCIDHINLRAQKKSWWISLYLFLTMLFVGASAEFGGMELGDLHSFQLAQRYDRMLLCIALLLIYIIPFVIFIQFPCRKMHVSKLLPVAAFFAGWFIPGWIAGELNDAAADFLTSVTSKHFVKIWGDALTAPFIEETLKVLVVVWLLSLIHVHEKKNYLISGMAAGMGFQISEDLSYIEEQIAGSQREFADAVGFTLNDRISASIVSHWMYTGIMAVGVYLFFVKKQKKEGVLLMLSVILNHLLWDSPVNETGALVEGLIAAAMMVVFARVYIETMQEAVHISLVSNA